MLVHKRTPLFETTVALLIQSWNSLSLWCSLSKQATNLHFWEKPSQRVLAKSEGQADCQLCEPLKSNY